MSLAANEPNILNSRDSGGEYKILSDDLSLWFVGWLFEYPFAKIISHPVVVVGRNRVNLTRLIWLMSKESVVGNGFAINIC